MVAAVDVIRRYSNLHILLLLFKIISCSSPTLVWSSVQSNPFNACPVEWMLPGESHSPWNEVSVDAWEGVEGAEIVQDNFRPGDVELDSMETLVFIHCLNMPSSSWAQWPGKGFHRQSVMRHRLQHYWKHICLRLLTVDLIVQLTMYSAIAEFAL